MPFPVFWGKILQNSEGQKTSHISLNFYISRVLMKFWGPSPEKSTLQCRVQLQMRSEMNVHLFK